MDESLKQALHDLRSFVSEMPQKETTPDIKAALGNELAETIRLLGAKGDLLRIVGSYGDTLDEEELLSQLRAWNAKATEEFEANLPRSEKMDGSDLRIEAVDDDGTVRITDGVRSADYTAYPEEPLGNDLRIVPSYVETGWFTEAHAVTLTDGTRKVVYVPVRGAVRYR
jgi:hypothetical protein